MRGNRPKEQKANHIVSAWCDMDGFCLGQKKVEEKSNETSEYFGDGELLEEIKENGGYKITKEKSHSQIETREYYQCNKIGWMQGKSRWKGIKSKRMICKTTEQSGKQAAERRYYISSLPLNVELFARTVGGTLASGNYALAFGTDIKPVRLDNET